MVASSSALGDMMYASSVEYFDQGLRKGGSAVDANRSDPLKALGVPEGNDTLNFLSLGIGGTVILGFEESFTNDTATVWETTYGSPSNYPESAEFWIGAGNTWDTAEWFFVTNMSNAEDGQLIPLGDIGGETTLFQFVKLVDTTNISIHNSSADGYDLDGLRVSSVPAPGAVSLAALSLAMAGGRNRRRL